MKLLIVTQKVDENDDVLGFFHDWLLEFAKQCEQVEVICLWEGKHSLPANVRVRSLGKEKGGSKLMQLLRLKYYLLTAKYDAVFVHMNPVYVVLAGWWWRLLGKKVVLWYTHKNVDLKLRLAEKFATGIATAAKESFNLKSKKVHVLGHGIQTERFVRPIPDKENERNFSVLCVGRITPIKHQDLLIEAINVIHKKGIAAVAYLVGAPVYGSDVSYESKLRKRVKEFGLENNVLFKGSVPNKDIARYYWNSGVSVNLVPTGGLDKTVFESLAARTPVITTNTAFASLDLQGLYTAKLTVADIADKIMTTFINNPRTEPEEISREYSVARVVKKILKLYE